MKKNLFLIISLFIFSFAALEQTVLAQAAGVEVSLNSEKAGTTNDSSVLTDQLKEIFKAREENGVFRADTNEIEKTVSVTGDRVLSMENFIKVFNAVNKSGAAPIKIPLLSKGSFPKPNPLTLLVFAGHNQSPDIPLAFDDNGLEISFIGKMPPASTAADAEILITADEKGGGYLLNGGKTVSPIALKTEIGNRLRGKSREMKIVFADAGTRANYGQLADIAAIIAAAGGKKVYFVTQSSSFKEQGVSFSLPKAWFKDEELSENSLRFRGVDDSFFSIDFSDELSETDPAGEIKEEYERLSKIKENFKELSMLEIDGIPGILKIDEDDRGWINWQGFRRKNGKFQYLSISFTCPGTEFRHRRYEFLNILQSIKFADG